MCGFISATLSGYYLLIKNTHLVISRAYRMGQSRNVIVYRLLCEDSVDERMTNLLEKKQMIFDQYADQSVSGQESLEITDKMMSNIIQEEIERINQKKQEAG